MGKAGHEKTRLRGFQPGTTQTWLYNLGRWLEALRSRGSVLCSENKGGDQLRGYSTADLLLCFRICKKQVFVMTSFIYFTVAFIIEPRREKTGCFAYVKTKTQISFAATAKLISAFVFALRIVQFLYYLNLKFQASSRLLWLYSPVCVGPGRKP